MADRLDSSSWLWQWHVGAWIWVFFPYLKVLILDLKPWCWQKSIVLASFNLNRCFRRRLLYTVIHHNTWGYCTDTARVADFSDFRAVVQFFSCASMPSIVLSEPSCKIIIHLGVPQNWSGKSKSETRFGCVWNSGILPNGNLTRKMMIIYFEIAYNLFLDEGIVS